MGSIGDCFDNSAVESFSGPCSSSSSTATTGAIANNSLGHLRMGECWYNSRRRHSHCDMLSPADYEAAHASAAAA